jgi:hypothetical protein
LSIGNGMRFNGSLPITIKILNKKKFSFVLPEDSIIDRHVRHSLGNRKMSKIRGIGFILVFLVLSLRLFAQQEEPLKETVSVINVEVPVRVFDGDQAVPGLNKDDFQIFEDGKPQIINGFYMQRKKMNAAAGASNQESHAPVSLGRYFVLVYRIHEYNQPLQDSLDYLFRSVLQPDDQLLVMVNNRKLNFERLGSHPQALGQIVEVLKEACAANHNEMFNYLKQIEQSFDMSQFKLALSGRGENLSPEYLESFLKSYLTTWKEFKRRYLFLDIDKYYNFARHLEHVKKEKWVLNFYQLEQFPDIAFSGQLVQELRGYIVGMESAEDITISAQALILRKAIQDIEMEMKMADDFPSAEVSKLFYKVNATFHSFFMRVAEDSGSPELQFRNIATDIENSLRSIAEKTGGSLLASNDLTQSLVAVSKKEDVYYMLTYEPGNAKKIGKIKVIVNKKNYDVEYDNNIRADYINEYLQKREAKNPTVRIRDLSFKDKTLSLSISYFSQTRIEDETTGMVQIRIRVKNNGNQTFFDQTKALQAPKKTFSLSLDFNFLAAGKYDIIVDVLDQVSGKTCTEIIQPLVE